MLGSAYAHSRHTRRGDAADRADVAGLAPDSADPWFGTWTSQRRQVHNRRRSLPFKRATCRIEPWEDGVRVTYDHSRAGRDYAPRVDGKFDGTDYPVQGSRSLSPTRIGRVDDRTYEVVRRWTARCLSQREWCVARRSDPDDGDTSGRTARRRRSSIECRITCRRWIRWTNPPESARSAGESCRTPRA